MQWFDFTNVDTLLAKTFDQFRLRKLVNQLTQGNFLGKIPNVVLSGTIISNSVSAVISNGLCTITHTNHGYSENDAIVLTGSATTGTFAGFYIIFSVTANTYSFYTSATGTVSSPVETFWFSGNRGLGFNLISNVSTISTGIYNVDFENTQSDKYYGSLGIILANGGAYEASVGFTNTSALSQVCFQIDSNPASPTNGFQLYYIGIS